MQFLAGRVFSSAAVACGQNVLQHAGTAGRAGIITPGSSCRAQPRKTRAPALLRGREGGQSRLADLLSALRVPGEGVPFHGLGRLCIF